MDDGVLNTLIVKEVSRRTFLRFVGPYAKGEYPKFPQLARCVTGREIRIQSQEKDIVTCLDGEAIRSRDVTLRLSERKVNFFAPEGCSCNATARDLEEGLGEKAAVF